MVDKAYDDDLLDLDLSHEPDTTTSNNNNDNNNSMYPAFQSIDDQGPAYNNTFEENAPMLGQISPKAGGNDKIDSSNTIGVTVTQPIASNTDKITNNNDNSTSYGATAPAKSVKCWQIEYYQPYFNVDTMSLLQRLKKSMLPTSQFLDKELNEEPDLYGPFWTVSTLVFLMAAMGNLNRFLHSEKTDSTEWESDIKKISEAASLLYSVNGAVPVILYFLYRNWNAERGFIELVSLYGYSMFPFVPACILCVVPWNIVQWIVVGLALIISCWFLVKNLYLPLAEDKRQKPGYYIIGLALFVQIAIALALKVYFFQY